VPGAPIRRASGLRILSWRHPFQGEETKIGKGIMG
jgi:hypothetical protein